MSPRNAVIRAVALSFGVGLILPVIFGDAPNFTDRTGGDTFRNTIYDFQTLIGGILAICAAWWTVVMMEKTEEAASRRHHEQVALTTRGDKLAVERAVYPQINSLIGTSDLLRDIRQRMLAQNTYIGQLQFLVSRAWVLQHVSEDMAEFLSREPLIEGSRFFDGMLTFRLNRLRKEAIVLKHAFESFETSNFYVDRKADQYDLNIRWRIDPAYGVIIRLVEEIPLVVELLDQTAERYGVKKH